jgi:hypothetical protein
VADVASNVTTVAAGALSSLPEAIENATTAAMQTAEPIGFFAQLKESLAALAAEYLDPISEWISTGSAEQLATADVNQLRQAIHDFGAAVYTGDESHLTIPLSDLQLATLNRASDLAPADVAAVAMDFANLQWLFRAAGLTELAASCRSVANRLLWRTVYEIAQQGRWRDAAGAAVNLLTGGSASQLVPR